MSAKPHMRNKEAHVGRANAPRLFVCPACGETLSGPARFYSCPGALSQSARKVRALVPFRRNLS